LQKKIEKMRAEKEREELEKALVKEIEEDFK